MNKLVIITGPSGAGKTSVAEVIMHKFPLVRAVTSTTRPKREGEVEGVHYYFKTIPEFQSMISQDELVEHEEVYEGGFYGLPKFSLKNSLSKSHTLVVLDVEGALKFVNDDQKVLDNPTLIIAIWDEKEILQKRIFERGLDPNTDKRILKLEKELEKTWYMENKGAVLVQNKTDQLLETVNNVSSIIESFLEQ